MFQDHVLYLAVLLQNYAGVDGREYSEILYIIPLLDDFGIGKECEFPISDLTDRVATADLKYKIGLFSVQGYDTWRPVLPSAKGENLAWFL